MKGVFDPQGGDPQVENYCSISVLTGTPTYLVFLSQADTYHPVLCTWNSQFPELCIQIHFIFVDPVLDFTATETE